MKKETSRLSSETPVFEAHLREMVSCRTISDKKYFEQEEFDRFTAVLRKNYPLVFEKGEVIEGSSTFIRIPGKRSSSPLLLMSHKDVVHQGSDKKWKHPAFAGETVKGRMFARGSFDCKGSLCCIFEAMEKLLEEGFVPEADIWILSTSNEETAGNDAPDAVEYFRKNGIVPGLVIDEGGALLRVPFPSKAKRYAMVGAVERSSARLFFDCESEDAAKKLGKKITSRKFGHFEITPEIDELAKGLSANLKFPVSSAAAFLSKHKKAGAFILTHAGPDARAFCGSSTGWGILRDEDRREAEKQYGPAKIPLRVSVSGNYYNKLDDLIKEVTAFAGKNGAKIIGSSQREADPPVPSSSEGFEFIRKVSAQCLEKTAVLPYPVLGRTDARYFVGFADNVVRFVPLEISLTQMMKFHCPNENIFVDSLAACVEFYICACRAYR